MTERSYREKESHFSWWMPTYVTVLIMGISILIMFNLDELTARSMMNDDGLVQILTAVILNAGWIFCLQRALRKIPPAFKWGQLSYLILIYAMREMDFHRRTTEETVDRLIFFTGPYPLHEKIIGGIIWLVFIVVLLHFVGRNFRSFWKACREKQSWAVHVLFWAFLFSGSQALDKSMWHGDFAEVAFEENMEFGAAIMMLIILLKYPLNLPERPAELK